MTLAHGMEAEAWSFGDVNSKAQTLFPRKRLHAFSGSNYQVAFRGKKKGTASCKGASLSHIRAIPCVSVAPFSIIEHVSRGYNE